MDLNSFNFTGRVTQAPTLTVTSQGLEILTINAAINSGFGKYAKTMFIKITVFGKQGPAILPHLPVGKQIAVQGELSIEEWVSKKDNSLQKQPAVKANSVVLLSGGPTTTTQSGEERRGNTGDFFADDLDGDIEDAETSPV